MKTRLSHCPPIWGRLLVTCLACLAIDVSHAAPQHLAGAPRTNTVAATAGFVVAAPDGVWTWTASPAVAAQALTNAAAFQNYINVVSNILAGIAGGSNKVDNLAGLATNLNARGATQFGVSGTSNEVQGALLFPIHTGESGRFVILPASFHWTNAGSYLNPTLFIGATNADGSRYGWAFEGHYRNSTDQGFQHESYMTLTTPDGYNVRPIGATITKTNGEATVDFSARYVGISDTNRFQQLLFDTQSGQAWLRVPNIGSNVVLGVASDGEFRYMDLTRLAVVPGNPPALATLFDSVPGITNSIGAPINLDAFSAFDGFTLWWRNAGNIYDRFGSGVTNNALQFSVPDANNGGNGYVFRVGNEYVGLGGSGILSNGTWRITPLGLLDLGGEFGNKVNFWSGGGMAVNASMISGNHLAFTNQLGGGFHFYADVQAANLKVTSADPGTLAAFDNGQLLASVTIGSGLNYNTSTKTLSSTITQSTGNVHSASALTATHLLAGNGGNNAVTTPFYWDSNAAETNLYIYPWIFKRVGAALQLFHEGLSDEVLTLNSDGTDAGVNIKTSGGGAATVNSADITFASNPVSDGKIVVGDGGAFGLKSTLPSIDTAGNIKTPAAFLGTNAVTGSLALTNPVVPALDFQIFATNGTPANGSVVYAWVAAALGGTNVFIPVYK